MKTVDKSRVYLWFILLLGTALRIYKLGVNSLWLDEACFIHFKSPTGGFWESIKYSLEKFPSEGFGVCNYGYYLFTIFWSSLFEGDFMLRLSSAIFGIFCIFFIFKLGKKLFDSNAGLIAAFMLSISPFHIYYSQEFRMYTLVSLLTLISAYFLKCFMQDGNKKYLWGYIIAHALNFYVHIATILVLFAQVIFYLFCRNKFRDSFKKWLTAQMITALLIMPGMLVTTIELMRIGRMEDIFRITVSTASQVSPAAVELLLYTFKNLCIGYYATAWIWLPTMFLFSILFILAQVKTKERESLHLCLFCLFVPVFIMYAGQKILYSDRYLIPSSLFLYLIVGRGITLLRKYLNIAILIVLSLVSASALNNYYNGYFITPAKQRISVHNKPACREAAKYIFDNLQDGDIVFHTASNTGVPFIYYSNYCFNKRSARPARVFDKDQISLVLYFTKPNELSCFKTWVQINHSLTKTDFPVRGHKRIWLVFSGWHFDMAIKADSQEQRKLQWLNKEYIKKETKYFKDIIVYLFVNPKDPV